jgi:hypothetical protein
MTDRKTQRVNAPEHIGAISIGDINHVVGQTATALTRPSNESSSPFSETPKTLYMQVESGSFRVQIGDTHETLTYAPPVASVSDGSGSLLIFPGMVPPYYTAPSTVTVVGSSASDVLTYWWV